MHVSIFNRNTGQINHKMLHSNRISTWFRRAIWTYIFMIPWYHGYFRWIFFFLLKRKLKFAILKLENRRFLSMIFWRWQILPFVGILDLLKLWKFLPILPLALHKWVTNFFFLFSLLILLKMWRNNLYWKKKSILKLWNEFFWLIEALSVQYSDWSEKEPIWVWNFLSVILFIFHLKDNSF